METFKLTLENGESREIMVSTIGGTDMTDFAEDLAREDGILSDDDVVVNVEKI